MNTFKSILLKRIMKKKKKEFPVSEEVCALDMQNGMTYIGQFVGNWNSALTNYCIISTKDIVNISNDKRKDYLEVVVKKYEGAKGKNILNKVNMPVRHSKVIVYHNNIFKKR